MTGWVILGVLVVLVLMWRARRRRALRLEPQLMVNMGAREWGGPRFLSGRPALRMPPVRHPVEVAQSLADRGHDL